MFSFFEPTVGAAQSVEMFHAFLLCFSGYMVREKLNVFISLVSLIESNISLFFFYYICIRVDHHMSGHPSDLGGKYVFSCDIHYIAKTIVTHRNN